MAATERPEDPVACSRDVNIRGVLLFGFGLAVVCIAVLLMMSALFRLLEREKRREDKPLSPMVSVSLRRTPPEPRLEPKPLAPRARMRAEEDAILKTYGWVDPKSRVVRIPIDRAMDLLVERGLPASKPMAAVPPAPAAPGATR